MPDHFMVHFSSPHGIFNKSLKWSCNKLTVRNESLFGYPIHPILNCKRYHFRNIIPILFSRFLRQNARCGIFQSIIRQLRRRLPNSGLWQYPICQYRRYVRCIIAYVSSIHSKYMHDCSARFPHPRCAPSFTPAFKIS